MTTFRSSADLAAVFRPPDAGLEPKPVACRACDDLGWEPMVSLEGVRSVRKCQQCEFWDRKRGKAPGVPEGEAAASLVNFQATSDNAQARHHADLFLKGVHPDLYLWGPVGTGKTRLACSILNQLWRGGTRVLFVRTADLLQRLVGKDEGDALYLQVIGVPVLCLDDIGANQGTDYARRVLGAIYDLRKDKGGRTLFTSNLDLGPLEEHLGDERLASRIAGQAMVVAMRGPDWRLKKAKQRKAVK